MWQDIETAPKDETDVLLYRAVSTIGQLPPIVAAWFDDGLNGAGWASFDKPDSWIDGVPTHWQPLPEPPNA